MTVKELIEYLQEMPEKAIVLGERYSDFTAMQPPELQTMTNKGGWYSLPYPPRKAGQQDVLAVVSSAR